MQSPDSIAKINARFYDKIAEVYDTIDRRRALQKEWPWLDAVLSEYSAKLRMEKNEPLVFVDAGAGSGLLSERARHFFDDLILVDISQAMLDRIQIPGVQKRVGDCGKLPCDAESVDFIGAFATLHHLHSPELFFKESHRVLRPGGYLFTDHDIEKHFVRTFSPLLKMYRHFFDHGHDYLAACKDLTQEDYLLTEYHGDNGLDADALSQQLESIGFELKVKKFHWEGMGTPAKLVAATGMKSMLSRRYFGPVFRLVAQKRFP